MRRVGVLIGWDETDPEAQANFATFVQELQRLSWTDGNNLRLDVRWSPGNLDQIQRFAKELVDLKPDVILAQSTPVTAALQRGTQTIPIVFVIVSDPIGQGFVASLPRPGGNITGFSHIESSLPGKWVELLTEIAPAMKRVAAMFNPDTAPYVTSYYLPTFEAAAQSLKIEPIRAPVRDDNEIEAAIGALGGEPLGGLVAMPDNSMDIHRARIISVSAHNKVPSVYQIPVFARDGGLLSYGADHRDIFVRAATYVDRILRGAKPEELPVQMPTKFLMTLNARTARALGLAIPPSILIRADEVIE
jgi:putative ABC transport system substrate-binding protein